ncbi:MAG: nicotinamide mononucleotide transporter, partial [Clostridia bacterium]|nr:nicotinamide mononucleotide transporter [Clostridia bacterium]
MKRIARYFTTGELLLWLASVLLITVFFCLFDRQSYHTLVASLIGVTSLIFLAKGNPIGQMLMVVFSVLYGVISFNFCYYGEMITYLGMTLPMSVVAFIAWIKNPYKGNRSEVAVNKISVRDHIFMCVLTPVVTVAFYFILKAFGTANLLPSTISVATSFVAV